MSANNVHDMSAEAYDSYIESMRKEQYPMLRETLYLDHAGTTPYSKRLMDHFHAEMMGSLFGNPHSVSPSSQRSTQMIEDTRLQLLSFCGADPDDFDVVFTANSTAAIKLVMEAFREQDAGFWYGYHVDSHTSLVGVREAATMHRCFESDSEVESWIGGQDAATHEASRLFAYPAQSNMTGRRLPLDWCSRLRQEDSRRRTYTLLDAAAYASTSPLNLRNTDTAPEFTVLSLYKIFGFPDLGALIVRKDCAPLFRKRSYFGGGTVDMVVCLKEQWHALKSGALHEQLEDGTLPIHSIIALKAAMETHLELFGTLERVSRHTAYLTRRMRQDLAELKHGNGKRIASIYGSPTLEHDDENTLGPIIAFNLLDSRSNWFSNTEVEKLASVKGIHLRTGGVCNPGGIAHALGLSPWEMRENFSAGHRCGSENDIMNGKPTGVIRVSLGATSTISDVDQFLDFVKQFFVEEYPRSSPSVPAACQTQRRFHIESLTVYPIKSCAGWQIPYGNSWEVREEGLAWDREWCIVHQGTGKALSQKQHPRMALMRPHLDFAAGLLHITAPNTVESISVPLSRDPRCFEDRDFAQRDSSVCGEVIQSQMYTSPAIAEYLTKALGVPCTFARFPAASAQSPSMRHSKAHLPRSAGIGTDVVPRILLSNESPILTISRSSLNRLNEQIKAKGGKAAHPAVFRANILLAESPLSPPGQEQPWAEDQWRGMRIDRTDGAVMEFLGGCRRCQMVCIDQRSGEKNQEPFVTLAKTRRFDGRVLFGVHTALATGSEGGCLRIAAGDFVETFT
ncbi:PLP-dependent transferase [Hortaea werneckii]|nr:PLP-dependent transferase [Hortaea werneckii]KAI6998333.1 PLP-dependent transferase [Hortaea werneckii]KAI7149164.1 PLP-dependent transferase [Hortaea werneckii]KAI7176306.1 PLP-dependent transferase [Hortaea werneckii]KAI7512159.1 PLP-dependent transferase [Hortaea werneckii]